MSSDFWGVSHQFWMDAFGIEVPPFENKAMLSYNQ